MALGRPRKIESPEKLYEYFLSYEEETKAKPFLIKDWVGKDAFQIEREKERPLTMEGFECWLFDNGIISDLSNYLANSNNAYSDFSTICSHIRKRIRKDQIEGGMAGQYNPSITQRLNNLVEKQELSGEVKTDTTYQIKIVKPLEDDDD